MTEHYQTSSLSQSSTSALAFKKKKQPIIRANVVPVKLDFSDTSSSKKFKVKIIQKINFSTTKSIKKHSQSNSKTHFLSFTSFQAEEMTLRKEERWLDHFYQNLLQPQANPQEEEPALKANSQV